MSKRDLIYVVNSVYVQLWDSAKHDPDLVEEMRTLSQLEKFTKLELRYHLALLHGLYPIQVEETVIDVVQEVIRRKGSHVLIIKKLILDVAFLWLDCVSGAELSDREVLELAIRLFSFGWPIPLERGTVAHRLTQHG